MCLLPQSSCCTLLTVMQWPLLTGTLVPHEGKSWQLECEKAIPEWAPFHPSNWLTTGHTSKANIPEISVFYLSCHHVVGQWIAMVLCLCCRRGLLAYVYTGVSVLVKCLSGGKVALIYYGSVALTFTVRQNLSEYCSSYWAFAKLHHLLKRLYCLAQRHAQFDSGIQK